LPAISKREVIVSTALELFYQHGFHATGIDKIITQAGVSKKTLYNHFTSKNELILATLRLRDELFRNNIMRETEQLASTPKTRLLSIFDAHATWFNSKTFSGCMFINAAAEFSPQQDPIHIMCAEHKKLLRDYIENLAKQAMLKEPSLIASQINLLLEGAIVEAYVGNNKQAVYIAKNMAELVINNACP